MNMTSVDVQEMFGLKGIDHIGIPCRDIEKTVSFYNRLGFEMILRTVNEKTGEKVAFLRMRDLVVETYQSDSVPGISGAIDHMAISVKDIDECYNKVICTEFGNVSDIEFLPFWKHGIRFFKINGPNGESIEFVQKL